MHAVQGPLDDFRIDLGGQRLADAGRAGAEHRRAARLAGDDVVHQHVHLGGQDVDQVGLLRRQHQLVLEFRLVGVGRHVVDMHPDVMVQVEVEHQHVEMHGQLREQALGDAGLGLLDFRLLLAGQPGIALHAADELGQDVAGRVERQHALAEDALVVDQTRRAAGRGQDDDVLARIIGVAMRRCRVLGEVADTGAGKLRAVLRPPLEITLGAFVVALEQFRRFLDEALGRQNFRNRTPCNVRPGNAQRRRRQPRLGVGFQFEKDLAGFLFRRRREVQPRHHVGERLAGDAGREQPAARRAVGQITGDGRHRHLQLFRLEALAAFVQRLLQRRDLGATRPQFRPALRVQSAQETQFLVAQLAEGNLDLVAEAQLLLNIGQSWKGLHHRLDVQAVDLQLH